MTDETMELKDYHCVDKHREVEQSDGIHHKVVFHEDLEIMYGRLLDVIRRDGYEVVAFGPNYTIDDPEDDDIHELMQINTDVSDPSDNRVWAVFVETDEPFDQGRWSFDGDDVPSWVDDIPR